MAEIFLHDLTDTRLDFYRQLSKSNQSRLSDTFVVEGRFATERLLQSDYTVNSIVVSEKKREQFKEYVNRVTDLIIMPQQLVEELVGYNFHQGVLACGVRKKNQQLPKPSSDRSSLFIACPHITNPDNLGTIMRLARAFGAEAVLVGNQSTDPFSRRALRVSMGNTFFLPVIVSDNLEEELRCLQSDLNYELVATVLNEKAEPLMEQTRPKRLVLFLGNEENGLAERWLSLCDRQVTIPMDDGTDSLNVALSAGIFLYHYTRLC